MTATAHQLSLPEHIIGQRNSPNHSPWQRGTNENTNGLIRQYFPKGTDLSLHTRGELDRIVAGLMADHVKTLNWRRSVEAFEELIVKNCVAMTD
jgi:IS30 family transposase